MAWPNPESTRIKEKILRTSYKKERWESKLSRFEIHQGRADILNFKAQNHKCETLIDNLVAIASGIHEAITAAVQIQSRERAKIAESLITLKYKTLVSNSTRLDSEEPYTMRFSIEVEPPIGIGIDVDNFDELIKNEGGIVEASHSSNQADARADGTFSIYRTTFTLSQKRTKNKRLRRQ